MRLGAAAVRCFARTWCKLRQPVHNTICQHRPSPIRVTCVAKTPPSAHSRDEAAAELHFLLMVGLPGGGKSKLAQRLAWLLPPIAETTRWPDCRQAALTPRAGASGPTARRTTQAARWNLWTRFRNLPRSQLRAFADDLRAKCVKVSLNFIISAGIDGGGLRM